MCIRARVHDALGDQIIHQRAEVAGVPGQDELFLPQGVTGGVQSCQQTLCGCFLVAGGAVELPGTVQAPDMLAFQCGFQAGGVYTCLLYTSRAGAAQGAEHPAGGGKRRSAFPGTGITLKHPLSGALRQLIPLPVSYTHLDVYKRQRYSCRAVEESRSAPRTTSVTPIRASSTTTASW